MERTVLTEDERARIRQEEIFRREVRQQLDAERPSLPLPSKLWKALNSAFVLWLLSSVILALAGWAYSRYQAHNSEQNQRKETRRKLISELTYRSAEALLVVNALESKIDRGEPDSPKFIASRILGIVDGRDIASLSPEYQNRSFVALLTELERLLTEEEKKSRNDMIEPYLNLQRYSFEAPESQPNDDKDEKSRKSQEAIQKVQPSVTSLLWSLVQIRSE